MQRPDGTIGSMRRIRPQPTESPNPDADVQVWPGDMHDDGYEYESYEGYLDEGDSDEAIPVGGLDLSGYPELDAPRIVRGLRQILPPLDEVDIPIPEPVADEFAGLTPDEAKATAVCIRDSLGIMSGREVARWIDENPLRWVVDELLPGSYVNLIAADPKTGKSTLLHSLALAVSSGQEFLGRRCVATPILYMCLEDHPAKLVKFLQRHYNNDISGLPIEYIIFAPDEFLQDPHAALDRGIQYMLWRYGDYDGRCLVLIDMLKDAAPTTDINNYGEMANILTGYIHTLRKKFPNVCIVFTHHTTKKPFQFAGIAATHSARVLGSTAITGKCHTNIIIDKDSEGRRYIESDQRDGRAIPKSHLILRPDGLQVLGRAVGNVSSGLADERERTGDKITPDEYRKRHLLRKCWQHVKGDATTQFTRAEICDAYGLTRTQYSAKFAEAVTLGYLIACPRSGFGGAEKFALNPDKEIPLEWRGGEVALNELDGTPAPALTNDAFYHDESPDELLASGRAERRGSLVLPRRRSIK